MADRDRVRVAVACQGGGSHTAFTAGVLRAMLRDERYDIVALSGTSGGAVCALLAWYGLKEGDRDLSARLLEGFWKEVAAVEPWDAWLNEWLVAGARLEGQVTLPAISPYLLPTAGMDRLRELLAARVPQEAFADPTDEPLLLVGAVDVLSGDFKTFSSANADVSVDAVLASAAVPNLFRAVHVGDRLYWDGLFSQNPPVRDLPDAGPDEIWVVQINPSAAEEEPTRWPDILDRRNELAGNLSLRQELGFIDKINEFVEQGLLAGTKYRHIPVDFVSLGRERPLDLASKLDRRPAFLADLLAYGEQQAQRFLSRRPQGAAR